MTIFCGVVSMQKINGVSMKKTYFKTVLFEFLAVCMAVLSINFNNEFNLAYSKHYDFQTGKLVMSFLFTSLFGVCIGLLCMNGKNKCSKKELYTDAAVRIGLATAFIIWALAMVTGRIKLSSYVLINFESVMRYGAVIIGVNIITGLRNIITGYKISETEKYGSMKDEKWIRAFWCLTIIKNFLNIRVVEKCLPTCDNKAVSRCFL